MNDKSPDDKRRPPTAPPHNLNTSMRELAILLWFFVLLFGFMARFIVINRRADLRWGVLFGALSVYLIITSVGVWRLKEWGAILLTVFLGVSIVVGLVSDVLNGNVIDFVKHIFFSGLVLFGLTKLWKTAKMRQGKLMAQAGPSV